MSNQFIIDVLNQNAEPANFAFFQALPKVNARENQASGAVAGQEVDMDQFTQQTFTNIWFSKGSPPAGSLRVEAHVPFYAWAGDGPQKAAVGVTVTSGKALPAKLGTDKDKGSTFIVSAEGGVVDIKESTASADPASFQIVTKPFTPTDRVMIGLAKPDPNDPDIYLPTTAFNAEGDKTYTLTPTNDFWIAKLAFGTSVGQIFDLKTLSDQKVKVAFSESRGKTRAKVVFKADGTFEATFP